MFASYTVWVSQNPFVSAFLQFMLLGFLGELLPHWIRKKSLYLPFTRTQSLGKLLAWGLLGLLVKLGFLMMKGAAGAIMAIGLLPAFFAAGIGQAFLISVVTNLFFGPQMMFFHRLEDNLILRERNWAGLEKAWWTLIWFWIPAHTVTFALPADLQIGLAALWSVVLGLIMGFSKR